jgi:hypothetical protein
MVNVLGITVRTTRKQPHLRGVVVDTAGALVRHFEHLASRGMTAEEQLHALGQALASEVTAQTITGVVIREAGYAKGSGLTASVKNRLRAEGVALAVVRATIDKVAITDSNGIGHLIGVTAAEADRQGQELGSGEVGVVAAAALAAIHL